MTKGTFAHHHNIAVTSLCQFIVTSLSHFVLCGISLFQTVSLNDNFCMISNDITFLLYLKLYIIPNKNVLLTFTISVLRVREIFFATEGPLRVHRVT